MKALLAIALSSLLGSHGLFAEYIRYDRCKNGKENPKFEETLKRALKTHREHRKREAKHGFEGTDFYFSGFIFESELESGEYRNLIYTIIGTYNAYVKQKDKKNVKGEKLENFPESLVKPIRKNIRLSRVYCVQFPNELTQNYCYATGLISLNVLRQAMAKTKASRISLIKTFLHEAYHVSHMPKDPKERMKRLQQRKKPGIYYFEDRYSLDCQKRSIKKAPEKD